MREPRELDFYKDYFIDFYESLSEDAQNAIDRSFNTVIHYDQLPKHIFESVKNSDGIYEIKARYGSNQYRVLCFFEDGDIFTGKLIILGNGFVKKKKKDLRPATKIAEQIRNEYFEEKNNNDE